MNYILISKFEGFREGAERIKEEAKNQKKDCEIIEIQNIVDKMSVEYINKQNSLIYFLTNDSCVKSCIRCLKKSGTKVIGKKLLSGDVSKFFLQEKIKGAKICTPKSIPLPTDTKMSLHNKISFPLFLKSQEQVSTVDYMTNKFEFIKKLSTINNRDDFYLEEAIEDSGMILEKFYYINGSVFIMKSIEAKFNNNWIQKILKRISLSLELEVFSTDIFVNWSTKKYFCIDINPAPAFFNSRNARVEFVNNVLI